MDKIFEILNKVLTDIDQRPHFIAFFSVSSIFVLTALVFQNYFTQVFGVFIFSISGMMWRFALKDLRTPAKEIGGAKYKNYVEFFARLIYHEGNLILLYLLLKFLYFCWK